MARKGKKISEWNWQTYEREQGLIQSEDAKPAEDFDLVEELDRVDL